MTPGDRDNATWINGEITAVVSDSREKNGKYPHFDCLLSDPDDPEISINASFFGRRSFDFEGCTVRLSGQGMALKEYNGQYEISCGAKTVVQEVSGPSDDGGRDDPPARRATPAPARASSRSPAPDTRAEDVAIGRAINCAVLIITKGEIPEGAELRRKIWAIASEVRRAERKLAEGLAPAAGAETESEPEPEPEEEKPAPKSTKPPARPARDRTGGPGGSVKNDTADFDDIPF